MNIQQRLITIMVTVGILCIIGVGITHMPEGANLNPYIKYVIAAVAVMLWLFFVFIADLYMTMHQTKKDLEAYQTQFHAEIMAKYIDISKKCGVAVHKDDE
jgi:uncharacterized membrane protein